MRWFRVPVTVLCQNEAAATPDDPAGSVRPRPLRLISPDKPVVYHQLVQTQIHRVSLTAVWGEKKKKKY